MDNLKGMTLFNRIIWEGELNEEHSATVAAFLVSIVKYLHKNDVIIRNLKPEGIMFEEEDLKSYDLKLIDLVLANGDPNDFRNGKEDHLFHHY